VHLLNEAAPFDGEIEPNSAIIVWGTRRYSGPYEQRIREWSAQSGVHFIRMEDGFLRSVGLGAAGGRPYTVSFDDLGIYYDATRASRMETLFQTYSVTDSQLARARECIGLIVERGISKTNSAADVGSLQLYGPKTRDRVLVLGQVGDDESIIRGTLGERITCNELVRRAKEDNPGAEIIYKPHPEVARGLRNGCDPDEVAGICKVITKPCSLRSSFETIDKIYTITSLSGFEGALRGIPVVCFGTPFYSGWGFTDDRDAKCARRTRVRSIEEAFVLAYMVYPDYFDADSFGRISIEGAIEALDRGIQLQRQGDSRTPLRRVFNSSRTATCTSSESPTGR